MNGIPSCLIAYIYASECSRIASHEHPVTTPGHYRAPQTSNRPANSQRIGGVQNDEDRVGQQYEVQNHAPITKTQVSAAFNFNVGAFRVPSMLSVRSLTSVNFLLVRRKWRSSKLTRSSRSARQGAAILSAHVAATRSVLQE